MTEHELREAYRHAARADLEGDREPATGVPLDVHEELRAIGLELATVRELLEELVTTLTERRPTRGA